jgi:hypothetical protein
MLAMANEKGEYAITRTGLRHSRAVKQTEFARHASLSAYDANNMDSTESALTTARKGFTSSTSFTAS